MPNRAQPAGMPAITERRFQNQILELAKVLHWRTYHPWTSIHSAGGFPDLVLVRRPRVIFAELKSDRGQVSDDQWAWLEDLRGCGGVEVYVWRPSDFEEIKKVLMR